MKYITLIVLVFAILSCNSIQEPTLISIENIDVKEMNTERIIADATLILDNPNSFALDLENLDISAVAEEIELAHIIQSLESTMPANAEFKLPVSFKMDLKKLYGDNPMLALSKGLEIMAKKSLEVQFKGSIRAGKGSVKVKIPIDQVEEVKF